MRYLSEQDLRDLVPPRELIATIERGLIDMLDQKVILRPRDHITFGDNTLLTMPVVGTETFGAKLVSMHPSNVGGHLPVINGLMILCDRHTGQPLAVMNAAALTAQRTGAVGAIGLKYTTPPHLERIGIVGTGVQGTWQAVFACAVRPIRTIYFADRSEEKANLFAKTLARQCPHVSLVRCPDVPSLVMQSQAIITATTSNVPVLPNDPTLLESRHFISVGSFKPTMQELPDAVFELARTIVVDSDVASHEVGDLINPLAAGRLRKQDLIHLAELVVGRGTFAIGITTVFKSVGMALYDLYAAEALNAAAEAQGRGVALTP